MELKYGMGVCNHALFECFCVPWFGQAEVLRLQKRWVLGMWCSVASAMMALFWAFSQNDFSFSYVFAHAHTTLPLMYRLAALWGGHEGSLLLWLFFLATWCGHDSMAVTDSR